MFIIFTILEAHVGKINFPRFQYFILDSEVGLQLLRVTAIKQKAALAAQGEWIDEGRVKINKERSLRQCKINLL